MTSDSVALGVDQPSEQGSEFPIFVHHAMAFAAGIIAVEDVLEFERNFARWFIAGFAIVPQAGLSQFFEERSFPFTLGWSLPQLLDGDVNGLSAAWQHFCFISVQQTLIRTVIAQVGSIGMRALREAENQALDFLLATWPLRLYRTSSCCGRELWP